MPSYQAYDDRIDTIVAAVTEDREAHGHGRYTRSAALLPGENTIISLDPHYRSDIRRLADEHHVPVQPLGRYAARLEGETRAVILCSSPIDSRHAAIALANAITRLDEAVAAHHTSVHQMLIAPNIERDHRALSQLPPHPHAQGALTPGTRTGIRTAAMLYLIEEARQDLRDGPYNSNPTADTPSSATLAVLLHDTHAVMPVHCNGHRLNGTCVHDLFVNSELQQALAHNDYHAIAQRLSGP